MGMQHTSITTTSHCPTPVFGLNLLTAAQTNEELENEITTLAANINAAKPVKKP